MPQFNILKKVFRPKRDKAHRVPSGPDSSGQHSGERTPDAAMVLLDITLSISEAKDLRDPLNFTSEALMKVLDTAKVSTFSIQLSPFGAENRIEYRFIERRLGFTPQETSVPP
jgi:hypothetical protein